jgi:hypothetical protein
MLNTTSAAAGTSRGLSRHFSPCSISGVGLGLGPVGSVHIVAGVKQATRDAAGHRSEADESDRAHRVPPSISANVVVGELEARGGEDRVDLVGAAEADDRAGDGGVAQHPGDGDRAGGGVVAIGDRSQALDQVEVSRQLRLVEPWVVLAPVVLG